MKIVVISDSHDNLANIAKAVDILKKEKIKTVLHCGDICSPATLSEIMKTFSGRIQIVFGNVDGDRFSLAKIESKNPGRLKIHGESADIKISGKKIAFCHSPEFARGLAARQKYDFVFYGHNHKPWEEKIGRTRLVNPGNLAGLFYRATLAVCDLKTGKLELKILK
ncbi:MAG TPA: YfcE family phosphodiesterase [Patescibacteria group bacterium]|nr:YfcE family phosphodiesterase [Patescibacteria group bacterium]